MLNGVGIHLHIEHADGRVLLRLRHPESKHAGDTWHYLARRCEQEPALACSVREAREEAGLFIDPADVELAHVVHVVDARGSLPLMQLVFRAPPLAAHARSPQARQVLDVAVVAGA
ncbi:NUDIX domain-containing protein [[Kitasatospora] papulosa]|uniref:NUDIX domain-containing protein n=1 Tax=[Kitasatospora] papulosa TaxID=1464011 RepID=UPI003699D141